ncbi:MAG: Unknown protein [uncultured Sulfurovum sp.]|uniref:Uncharacterized protein n=1 Tax=uncultured Sulfurovum sp. TaxID=269237 RepID=A0A6S6TW64_9BACT|nr:MAG: Unknown protein [uncultured Sulfurovum sp.]
MLTVYSDESSFKKKLTVVVIWLIAFVLSFLLFEFIRYEPNSLLNKILPTVIGLFMIAGILLRCKFARAFALITLYGIALFPLVANFLMEESLLLFLADTQGLFSPMEALLTNIVWALLFILPIYFLSNDKSMEIFFIEPHPIEHLFFILVAIGLVYAYFHFVSPAFFRL